MKISQSKIRIYADLAMLVAAVIWGSGFVVAKFGLDYIGPLYITAFRFTAASLLMALLFRKKLGKINKKDVMAGIIIGIFLFAAFVAHTVGLKYTTAGVQAFLIGTNVVMVPFLYWAVKSKRPKMNNIIAAVLAFAGIGFLSLNEGFSMSYGDSLTLLCAFLFACHIVSIGCFAKKHDPIILTMLQFGVAAVLSIIAALLFESAPESFAVEGILAVLYLTLFNTLLAFLIQNIAQKYTSPSRAAVILCMESVFGSIMAVFFLGEIFTGKMLLGCIVIFSAVLIATVKWGSKTEVIEMKNKEAGLQETE